MTTNFPLPITGRSSDLLVYQRLLAQTRVQEESLLRIQEQLSSGRRINRPSDDPFSANRALQLQRLLEKNTQYQTNIEVSDSFLTESDSVIASSTNLLREVRGLALTAVDATTDERGREAIVDELRQTLTRFVTLGNSKTRDRYLFAGSDTTVRPYSSYNQRVTFEGNTQRLDSFVDLGTMLSSNITGPEVFGGESIEVQSAVDLNPVLAEESRLRFLNSGRGVQLGRIEVSDGGQTSVVDLRNAETVSDVVRLLERNPPLGRQISVEVTANSINVTLDSTAPGNLTIRDIDGGRTARDLGIETPANGTSNTVMGTDLDPALNPLSRIDELLGVRASVELNSTGEHNDIRIRAREVGTQLNDYSFQYVDDELLEAAPGLGQGDEFVSYSATPVAARGALTFSGPGNNLQLTAATSGAAFNQVEFAVLDAGAIGNAATVNFDAANGMLQIGVDSSGATQIQTVINAINAEGTFNAAYDPSDASDGGFNPAATINPTDIGVVRGNTGNSGGDANTVFIHVDRGQTTANDVIDAFNANAFVSNQFTASLINTDSTNGINNGSGAIDPRAAGNTDGGTGEPLDVDSGLRIALGPETHVFDLADVTTVQDFLNKINQAGLPINARINERANSIDLVSRVSGIDFSIGENGGTTATQLGLRTFTAETYLSDLNYGQGVSTSDGTDFTIRRNDGSTIELDVSAAETVGDVLDIINSHPSNQDPTTRVEARLAVTGNGIEIVDDNPPGDATVAVVRDVGSLAAVHLGLVPPGEIEGYPGQVPPTPATLSVSFAPPDSNDTSFNLTAAIPGTEYNGVSIEIISSAASGDEALVNFDSATNTLTIDVDPSATRANTVVSAITSEGTFQAELNRQVDVGNTGNGLVPAAGPVGTTSGGSSQPTALPATAGLQFASPNNINTALNIEANQGGTAFNGVEVIFQDTLVGNSATATYDPVGQQLIVDLDSAATTSNTILAAINAEGTFTASLDTTSDSTNDGSGIPGTVGLMATTAGGTPEVLTGRDVNPQESRGIFNSISRMIDALDGDLDLEDAQRAAALIEEDLDRILSARSDVAVRQRSLTSFQTQLEDQELQLKQNISIEVDVDMIQAVSDLTRQQQSFEATLQLISRTLQTTLLDFI